MPRRCIAAPSLLAKATADPGTQFSYGPIPFQCFGELMRRKLEPRDESVETYMGKGKQRCYIIPSQEGRFIPAQLSQIFGSTTRKG